MTLGQAVSLSDRQVEGLLSAYFERKRFEAKITMSVIAEALKPKNEQASLASLAAMGFGIQGTVH